MIAAVFDCVVYIQAVLSSRGPAFACLALAEEEHVSLYISPDILDEVKRSLASPSLRRKYSAITDESVETFLARVVAAATLTQNPPAIFSLRRDPKDEPYLNLAIEQHVPFVVSRDKDLLDLMQDDTFRKTYTWLTVIDPAGFLKHVRAADATEPGDM
jgi:putative PIN family toxin of toxin-antitoxin system